MPEKYGKLFEPFSIGRLTLKNRIAMAPLGMVAMADPCGAFTENAQEYYVERARGGAGLILTGVTNVNYREMEPLSLPCASYRPLMFRKSCVPMNERIHAFGSKIFLQLTGGFGRVAIPALLKNAVAPSAQDNRWDPSVHHRSMTVEEIRDLVEAFAVCARIARESGFDGVEVHAVHEGYLLDQFAIALYNKRTDEYGGDLHGRLKLAVDAAAAIRKACGEDFPISLRYSLKSFVKGIRRGALPGETFSEKGRDIREGIEAAKILEKAGYSLFDVDAGTYDSWYWNHPPMYFEKGMYREFGALLKKSVKAPILLAGRMDNPDMACEALGTSCDIVALGRPLLADPDLPNKIRIGKTEDIRPCISCQQGCLARLARGLPLSCAVNPACGRERTLGVIPAQERKNVLVAGGGLAGMEAARVCAMRGHRVTLLEKGGRLGGNILPGSVPEFKEDDRALLRWYETQLAKLPVEVRLNRAADRNTVKQSGADVVICATGSVPIRLDFGGKDRACTADDVLSGRVRAGENVVVAGGGLVGCETGLWLGKQGRNVTIVEARPELMGGGEGMCFANYDMLKDLLAFHKIGVFLRSRVKSAGDGSAVVETPDGEQTVRADTVLSAVGYRPDTTLYDSIASEIGMLVYNIGDSRGVRNIMSAIWDAYLLAREI